MEELEPAAKQALADASESFQVAEVDDSDRTPRSKTGDCGPERLSPIRDHGKAVREQRHVERLRLAEEAGRKCLSVAMGQADTGAEAGAINRRRRRLQHLRGCIDAVKNRAGIAPCDFHQVSRRATADLDKTIAWSQVEFADKGVPPEEVVPARQIVDVALPAIDRVHQLGVSAGFRLDQGRATQERGRRAYTWKPP